jgi:hypothetical protein
MNAANPHSDIALTLKGEAYAVAHLRPSGAPPDIDAAVWRQAVETRIETLLDMVAALTDSLDQMDPDADLEPSMGWAWREPADGYAPAASVLDECEAEDDKAIEDDPHDHGEDDELSGSWRFANHISGGGSGI